MSISKTLKSKNITQKIRNVKSGSGDRQSSKLGRLRNLLFLQVLKMQIKDTGRSMDTIVVMVCR